MTADVYTGMTRLGEFDMEYIAENTYKLIPRTGELAAIEFIANPSAGEWKCTNCSKQNLDTTWLEQ